MSVGIKAAVSGSQVRRQASTAPVLTLSSGTLEALKRLALLLMTFDHVNKHLLHASVPELFAAGRLAMPPKCPAGQAGQSTPWHECPT